MDEDEILIGEGVALSTGAAPVPMRMLSGVIDVLVYGAAAIAVMTVVDNTVAQYLNGAAAAALTIIMIVSLLVLVPALVETLSRGRSLGHLAVGVRTVRDDGGPISFRHAFIRAFVGLIEIYVTLGMIAITASMLSARGKRVGDMLAGTFAMRTRGAPKPQPPVPMPAHLAPWATSADIRRLPDGLALTSRTFLMRAPQLRPDSRARLGTDITARVLEYVSPPPPADAHPEYVIAAVLAARGSREYAIEMRRQERRASEDARVTALPYGLPDA
ncbi:RDD family protein [Demequina globuliformis]|uniref:RDD family protein n=1 Tax=Demequina globuliformis TaxID=676202 RepID=UPI000B0DEB5D|nr:RDD family protein [Demequina globuliformis]